MSCGDFPRALLMRSFVIAAVLALLPALVSSAPVFNYTKCPAHHEVQLPHFFESGYNLHKNYPGMYYELAFHDILQAACLDVTCVNTNKTVATYPDGQVYVNEAWGMKCYGTSYPQVLLNNITSQNGLFEAYVPVAKVPFVPKGALKNLIFPNHIIDFRAGDTDGWTLEFQCFEGEGHVRYIGVNFYARNTTEEAYQDMLAAAKESGIDYYFDGGNTGFNFRRVNQTGC